MKNQEHETLESIIRAAKEMSIRRNPTPAPQTKQEIIVPAPVGPSDTDTNTLSPEPFDDDTGTEDLLSAASAFSETLQTTGIHFLEFTVAFLSMVKHHYQQGTGDIRANSLAFFALIALDNWASENYTMSDLADKLQIPKQQLTKLINDLEERQLVERIHDTANRRRVYIRICGPGRALMEDVKQEMLQATLHGLRSYNKEELQELDRCIGRLTELMERFNTEPV